MKQLHIYPTSRALRRISESLKQTEGFLPTLMRMDEFEKRAVLMEGRTMVDPLQRVLLLKEAAGTKAFDRLKIDRDLIHFFTKSDAFFKFFEELAAEGVGFETLTEADPYAEFDTHIALLETLQVRYKEILDAQGLTDRMFLPGNYRLNVGFVKGYDTIEIFLEGYLSRFELKLLEQISRHTQLIIHYATSAFNKKMLERFEAYGITLKQNTQAVFDLGSKTVLDEKPNDMQITASVFGVEERDEQIALAFMQIEEMVRSGIAPEAIVLILPDEGFKEHFMLFDNLNNLNFAMGYDSMQTRSYKMLDALYRYWQRHDSESRYLMERYGLEREKADRLNVSGKIGVEHFFRALQDGGLLATDMEERVEEKYHYFQHLFKKEAMPCKTWLFLWLQSLSKISIDDVRGGKITVMGVLETRGVSFEGVVIVDFNEGIVPTSSSKDLFLNSTVRKFAGLPTRQDREALQKQYYNRLLQQANKAVIVYSTSENRLPSRFLYELGLQETQQLKPPTALLYAQPSWLQEEEDPIVEDFNAFSQTWSASRLKTFLECKRKYYYRYICTIKAKEEEALNEGAFLHTLLEHLYQERDSYTAPEELTKRLHQLMDRLLPEENAQNRYRKLLWKEKLKGFVQKEIEHFNASWRVVEREVDVAGEIGGLKFKGRVDRIDQNKTDTLVLDYKSGKVEKEPRKLNPEKITDFQMSIYHQLLQGRYQNISLAFVKILDKGEKQHVTLLEERNALLAERIIELKQTTYFTAEKCEDLKRCKYCEFALMCGRGEYA